MGSGNWVLVVRVGTVVLWRATLMVVVLKGGRKARQRCLFACSGGDGGQWRWLVVRERVARGGWWLVKVAVIGCGRESCWLMMLVLLYVGDNLEQTINPWCWQ